MDKPIVLTVQKKDRYTRLRSIEGWQQDQVRQARVLVAGAGALGNEVLKNLALLGIGYIMVVDFDTIEITNLSRSILFRPGDESQSKADVAACRIRSINPDVQIEALKGDVVWDVGLGILSRFDAVLGCLDNREARLGLNRHCWQVGVPFIDGALGAVGGQVRLYIPPDSACYECGFDEQDYKELNLRYSCQLLIEEGILKGEVPTTPISASVIGAIQVQELLKLIHNQSVLMGHEIEYNGQNHIYRTTRLKRREDCLSHDSIPLNNIVTLPDATANQITGEALLQLIQKNLGEQPYLLLDREVVKAMVCSNCGDVDLTARPAHLTSTQIAKCPGCGSQRKPYFSHENRGSSKPTPSCCAGNPGRAYTNRAIR